MKAMFGAVAQSLVSLKSFVNTGIIPAQGVKGCSSTHFFINARAIQILFLDGHQFAARILNKYKSDLNNGCSSADRGVRSVCHHYNPVTGAGLWKWPSAYQKCNDYLTQAKLLWLNGKFNDAIFWLGAAAHLVQDLCVPHHAACSLFEGHLDFENWIEKHKEQYAVFDGGIYDLGKTPGEWVSQNACFSMAYLNLICPESPVKDFDRAGDILVKRAQRTTAGFFLYFFQMVYQLRGPI